MFVNLIYEFDRENAERKEILWEFRLGLDIPDSAIPLWEALSSWTSCWTSVLPHRILW